jgi:small conductance mechanosensitive channel
VIREDERFLDEPEPVVGVLTLGDSSVDLAFRPWIKKEDYWSAYFETLQKVKTMFDEQGITIPFPQTEFHIASESAKMLK